MSAAQGRSKQTRTAMLSMGLPSERRTAARRREGPLGGQRSTRSDKRGGHMSAARPPEGARAPLGGSAVRAATSVGAK